MFFAAIYFYLLFKAIKEKKIKFLMVSIMGSIFSFLCFIIFLLLQGISLRQFVYQTLIFPGRAKHPLQVVFSNCLGALGKPVVAYGLLVIVIVLFYQSAAFSEKFKRIFSTVILSLLLCVLPYAVDFININTILWYFLYYILAFIWLRDCLFQKNIFSEKSLVICSFFIFTFGIFSKTFVGPMWLWVFTISILWEKHSGEIARFFLFFFFLSMMLWNIFSARDVNFSYVDQSGDLYQETNIDSIFYKIGAKGNWIPEIENLSDYIKKNIGDKSFVEMPCEDPVYWASGENPQLDFFQAYPETCPYEFDSFAKIVYENDIDYVIVKQDCQFKHYLIDENNVDKFIDQLSAFGYKKKVAFDSYEIYQKVND